MTLKHGKLGFTGPATVRSGERLRVRNLTNSGRVGPHTFTLIRGNLLPRGQKEKQKCFTGHHVCNRVLKAHQVDFSTNPPTVGKPNVDDGTRGWDKQFGHHGIRGDSWFAPRKNDVTSRPVTAKPGTVLHFFCVVHPGMRGKIRVTR